MSDAILLKGINVINVKRYINVILLISINVILLKGVNVINVTLLKNINVKCNIVKGH